MGRSRLTAWKNIPVVPVVATSRLGCLMLPAVPRRFLGGCGFANPICRDPFLPV